MAADFHAFFFLISAFIFLLKGITINFYTGYKS